MPSRFGQSSHVIVETDRGPLLRSSFSLETEAVTSDSKINDDKNIPIDRLNGSIHEPKRKKRFISSTNKIPQVLHIETAIFVDKDLFRHMTDNYPMDTESKLIRFVLAMINGVNLENCFDTVFFF